MSIKFKFKTSFDHYPSLYFKCLECGQCCYWYENTGVYLTDKDIKRLFKAVKGKGASKKAFDIKIKETSMKEYVGELYTDEHGPGIYKCIFQGREPGRCKIYEFRPMECRLYPLILDLTSAGEIYFHIEHCIGVNFTGEGFDLKNKLEEFLSYYLEDQDLTALFIELRKKPLKPIKIKLMREDIYGDWSDYHRYWSQMLPKAYKEYSNEKDLLSDIISEFRNLYREFYGSKNYDLRRVSLLRKGKNSIVIPIINEERTIVQNELNLGSEEMDYILAYIKEFERRERTFGFLKIYDITIPQEVEILVNMLKDIFLILKTKKETSIKDIAEAIGIIDQWIEFYIKNTVSKKERGYSGDYLNL